MKVLWSGITRKGMKVANEMTNSETPMASSNLATQGEIRGKFKALKNRKETDVNGDQWFNPKTRVKKGGSLIDFIINMQAKKIVKTEAIENDSLKICPIERTLDCIPNIQVGRYIW